MKSKIISSILILMLLCAPSAAYATFNDYGYNAKACIFNGTLENWDNFIFNRPVSPVDLNAKDTMFLVRKWNSSFDKGMFQGKPLVDGSWQIAHLYQYLSGDMSGWTWNWTFKMVYSSKYIPGAIVIDEMPNFYIIQNNTWYTDPQGNEIPISEYKSIPPSLGVGLYKR